MATSFRIRRVKPREGTLSVWQDEGEIYIRESVDRGRNVQTVSLTRQELLRILELDEEDVKNNG